MLFNRVRKTTRGKQKGKLRLSRDAFVCDAPLTRPSADPTGTMDIRRKFTYLAGVRFRKIRTLLQTAVIANDMLGLKPGTTSPIAMALSPGSKDAQFRAWLSDLLQRVVIEGNGAWMRPLLQLSFNRALKRAMRLTKSNTLPTDMPETMDALLALCNVELRGICDAVVQRCARAASLAWLHNDKPAEAFKEMAKALQVVGITRTQTMGALMTVKTFNTATLDQFEAVGIKQVGLIPETKPRVRTKDYNPNHDPKSGEFSAGNGGGSGGRSGAIKGLSEEALSELLKIEREAIARVHKRMTSQQKGLAFHDARLKGPGSRSSREQTPSARTIGRIEEQEQNFEEIEEVWVVTADDPCPICVDIEDENPYTIDEARSLIPAHPNCQCAFVPAG